MASELHNRLCAVGMRWLKKSGFPVVTTELTCFGSRERPDVMAFRSNCSAVIEVKVSKADFRADRKKPERLSGGLGVYRLYLCPDGLILPEDLPPKWGLLYANQKGAVTPIVLPSGNHWPPLDMNPNLAALSPEWVAYQHTPDFKAERQALFSIARRLAAPTQKASE